jgi:RNA polymerase sigma-70 factor (ECF subfamily)
VALRIPTPGGSLAREDCEDERCLVARYREGDLPAFESLFRRHYPAVYKVALRLSAGADDAADVVQEVFLAVWEQRRRFDGRAAFRTWLIAIAIRKCADRARGVKAVSLDGPDPPALPAWNGASPDTATLDRERDEALHAAILALPRGQREAVVFYYIDGMSCAEAAAAMGVSSGTVMTHLFRARARLRKTLSWLGDEEPTP